VDDTRLRELGVEEKLYKGQRSGIFEADGVRASMLCLLSALDIPPALRTRRMREVYDSFRLVEGPLRAATIRRMYAQAYGDRLAARLEVFMQDVGAAELTRAQLGRFFRMHPSASKAKEGVPELLSFAEAKPVAEHDRRRFVQAADTLQFGLERTCSLLHPELRVWALLTEARDRHAELVR
jgi:hypothetical protein